MTPSRLAVVLSSAVTVGALLVSSVAPAGAVVPAAPAAVPFAVSPTASPSAGGAGAGSGTGATSTARPTPGASTHRITLVTGDVAELTITQGGQRSARLVDGGNYYLGDFENELTLVPVAAYPLLTEGRLDSRLFNLTKLVAQGYDDAATANLPLLLSAPAATLKAPDAPTAATKRMTLASVGTTAVTVRKDQAKSFWNGIKGNNNLRSGGAVGKIWLDGRTHATLDRSTKQIGAPDRLAVRVRRQGGQGRRPRHRVRRPATPTCASRSSARRASFLTSRSRTVMVTAPTPPRSSRASVLRPPASARASPPAPSC